MSRGTNFTFPSDIGWGGTGLADLEPVFDGIDGQFTSAKDRLTALEAGGAGAHPKVYATKAALKADLTLVDEVLYAIEDGGVFQYDADSAAVADDTMILTAAAGGRLLKVAWGAHSHAQSEVTGLVDALAGKAASGHTHSAFTGDSGAGGEGGMVPPPAAGDAAAGKVLGAGGGWVAGGTPGDDSVTTAKLANAADGTFAIPIVLHKIVAAGAGGAPDDVTFYAVNTLPFPIAIIKAETKWDAGNALGRTVELRTAAEGGGTLIATLDCEDQDDVWYATSAPTVIAPGALIGLFGRRSDTALGGMIHLTALKVSGS